MPDLPRRVTAPKLTPGQATLSECPELSSSAMGSDDLVTDLDISRLELAAHSTEFVEWTSLRIGGGTLADSDWYRMSWVDVALTAVDAANAAFTESTMKRVTWRQSRLVGIGLSGCTLQDVTHTGCTAGMANLRFANLQRVEFTDCDLAGADFTNARLTDVTFRNCVLDGARFSQARCERVLLAGGSMTGLKNIDGLRGASVRVDNVLDLAHELAAALGLTLVNE